MIKNFFNARFLVAAFCVVSAGNLLAKMTLTLPATPPDVVTSSGPRMWLDASDANNFVLTKDGGVEVWNNSVNPDNSATAVVAGSNAIVYGRYGLANGVAAYLMGNAGSYVDLGYERLTDIRTVFWVMSIEKTMNAFFLGDTNNYDFHRGSSGEYFGANWASNGFKTSTIRCDKEVVSEPGSTSPDTGLHVYSMVASENLRSNRLSGDRNGSQPGRNAGRSISELIVLNQSLSETQVAEVENYLTEKWMNDKWGNAITIDDETVSLVAIKQFMNDNSIVSARLKCEKDIVIGLDTSIEGMKLVIESEHTVTLSMQEGGNVEVLNSLIFFNGLGLIPATSFVGNLSIMPDGAMTIGGDVTFDVPYGEELRVDSLIGGAVKKTGEGTLRIGRVNTDRANIEAAKVEIEGGTVLFHEGDGAPLLKDATFILHEGAKLDNYGWPEITGTLTLKSDSDVTVFTNSGSNTAQFIGNPTIIKKGTGKIKLMCGAANDASHNNVIAEVIVESGTLSFAGSSAKVINAVSGVGTLEQAGGGVMKISKIAPKTSLNVSAGTLNNECAVGNGSITLAGLEIAAGATYTMKPAIDHLNLTKSFYLEGDAHKNWYVTLGDGALIATNPENPMVLAGLEFEESVKIGGTQMPGTVLAKVIKPTSLPKTVTSEDERLNKIPFSLEYKADSIVVGFVFGVELETNPGLNLKSSTYRVLLTKVPDDLNGSLNLKVRVTNSTSATLVDFKYDKNAKEWYAIASPNNKGDVTGGAYQLRLELGIEDKGTFVPLTAYDDISLNVRPDATNKSWIDEDRYQRWDTGTWNTEGEYITLADGYVQVAEDEKISFTPKSGNTENAAKLHFAVKFGEAMKLEILNALAEDGLLAGVALEKADDGTVGYAAWDPSAGEYIPMQISDKKPIDVAAEHLVEVTLTTMGVAYNIDGVALVTKAENPSAVFSLPTDASIKVAEIDFIGKGAVKSITADEYSTKLAKFGEDEYDTIEDAIIAATGKDSQTDKITIKPLWNVTWKPSSDLVGKTIIFKGNYGVTPNTNNDLAKNEMVLRPNEDGSYSVISKFLTVTIPDPEDVNKGFGVFLESVTTNSMHLGWVYEYPSSLAKATVVYDDDVTINFSTTIENKGLLVSRENTDIALESVTFKKVRYNIEVDNNDIPVLDKEPVVAQQTMAKFGVMKQDVARAESVGILDFTTSADGVTFTVGLLDAEGNDITKIVSEQIGEMVYFAEKLGDEWKQVGAENVEIITNKDGVQVMFAKQKDTTSGFYKVVIPDNAK